jgi:hypothetical protein
MQPAESCRFNRYSWFHLKWRLAEEALRQNSDIVVQIHSRWWGFRRFLLVGGLSFGLAIALALFIEHRHATPLCEQYAGAHRLTYHGLEYPILGKSSSTTTVSGRCLFADAKGHESSYDLTKLEPNAAISLLVGFALDIEFTIPVFFIAVSLLALGIGRLRRKH